MQCADKKSLDVMGKKVRMLHVAASYLQGYRYRTSNFQGRKLAEPSLAYSTTVINHTITAILCNTIKLRTVRSKHMVYCV